MIKFFGKPWAQKCFLIYLINEYGKNAKLKDVIEKEGKQNVSM